MFNRKIEARSQSVMNLATAPLLAEHHFLAALPIDQKLLELYYLFIKEERLTALIADDKKTVDKDTVYEVVASARKIAAKGYPTTLVSTDELLDIAQTFDPETASDKLIKILATLKQEGNSAWTARVAAALAYFSNLQGPSP